MRETVIRAYHRWLKSPSRIDIFAERALDRVRWEERDRALFLEILYGVIRWHGRLGWLIAKMSKGSTGKPESAAVAAAGVGLYQLFYLDRVPDYAAVDGAVAAAKRLAGPQAAGWVNAVLRRAARERESWINAAPPPGRLTRIESLAVRFSHPEWMIARWLKARPASELELFLQWNNRRPAITLRINRLKTDPEAIKEEMQRACLAFETVAEDPFFLRIEHSGELRQFDFLRDGRATVQDVSQGFVSRLVDARPGEEILDLCAAPGGKTSHLAELAPGAKIVATDKAEERLDLLRKGLERGGYQNVSVESYEAVIGSRRSFDAILLDVPCTGTGVLSRRPDLRWRRHPDDVRRMAAVQRSLLHYAAGRLKPFGRIIYSTCSVEPEENRAAIESFIAERREFALEKVELTGLAPERQGDFLEVWGYEIGADGVFAAALRRRG